MSILILRGLLSKRMKTLNPHCRAHSQYGCRIISSIASVPEISPAPVLFRSGSRTGENTFLSTTLSRAAFPETAPLAATVAAVVDPLRTPDRAGEPTAVPAPVRVCTGDRAVLVAEGRRIVVAAGSGWVVGLIEVEDACFALDSGAALNFFYNLSIISISLRANVTTETRLKAHTFNTASTFSDTNTFRWFVQGSEIHDQELPVFCSEVQGCTLW